MRVTLEGIEKVAKAAGFKWRRCSEWHVQMWHGAEVLNLYSGKRGFKIYALDMLKAQPVWQLDEIAEALENLKASAANAKAAKQSHTVASPKFAPAVPKQTLPTRSTMVDELTVFDAPLPRVDTVTAGLLTCPFCGSVPEERPDRKFPELIRIACTGCDSISCPYGLQHHKKDAIDDWNTRVVAGEKTTFRFEKSDASGEFWTATTSQKSYGPCLSLKELLAVILEGKKTC